LGRSFCLVPSKPTLPNRTSPEIGRDLREKHPALHTLTITSVAVFDIAPWHPPRYEKAAPGDAVLNTAAAQGMALVCKQRYASEAMSMSDQDDWEFADPDDAKAEIRAAVGYLLRGAIGAARGDIVQEIIAMVRQFAGGLPPEPPNPLDDGLPSG
jgi:hypothetical protein